MDSKRIKKQKEIRVLMKEQEEVWYNIAQEWHEYKKIPAQHVKKIFR
jgi:hypothetical protein